MTRIPTWIFSLLLLIILLVVWEGYVRIAEVSKFILPPPSEIMVGWYEALWTQKLWYHTWVTVHETLLGFFFAVVLGVGLGAIMGKNRWLERVLNPFVIASQIIPKVVLVPLFIVWFGFGAAPKVVIAAMLAFFPILVNTVLGFKSIERSHREVMISLNASPRYMFSELDFRSALPYILTGMELGIVLSIIGAVVGEFLGGNEGLGAMAVREMNSFNTVALFAAIMQLSAVGFVFYAGLTACRRFLIPWHASARSK